MFGEAWQKQASKESGQLIRWRFWEGEVLYGLVAGDPTSDYKEIMVHAQ